MHKNNKIPLLLQTFIHSTKHIMNMYHVPDTVPVTGNANMKVTLQTPKQLTYYNGVIGQVNKRLHLKFCNTEVATGYYEEM